MCFVLFLSEPFRRVVFSKFGVPDLDRGSTSFHFSVAGVLTGKKAYEFDALFTLCCVKIFSRS